MATSTDISPRRLIVHCGVQKTGTTSLHHFLQENRGVLSDRFEILTPQKGTDTQHLGRAAADFSLTGTDEHKQVFVEFLQAIKKHLKTGDTPALLSHENLVGAMLGSGETTDLYPTLPKLIRMMDRHLAPFVPHYVFYTRDMATWKKSAHNQAVKSDRYCKSYDEFMAQTADVLDWQRLYDMLAAELPTDRFSVFELENEPDPTRPGQQLLTLMGMADGDIASLRPITALTNQSLNQGALEFMLLANKSELQPFARYVVSKLVANNQRLFTS